MPRYFVRLSYKGTSYAGWQVQDNAVTVQGKVNEAISILAGSAVETTGCGRTDTGVHAARFYAHFDVEKSLPDISRFMHSANAILPDDIALGEVFEVSPDAHARYSATSRTYEYYITHVKNPFLREFTHYLQAIPDMDSMNEACALLLGTADFNCFSRTNSGNQHFICDIQSAHWENRDGLLVLRITANRFLRGMVRAIVGTLLEIGSGKRTADWVTHLIASKDRSLAGASAPAHGLFLCNITYPFLPTSDNAGIFNK